MYETLSVKLWRRDAIADIIAHFQDEENESQVVVDLLGAAVASAEILGWEFYSLIGIISEQRKIAEKFVAKLNEEETE